MVTNPIKYPQPGENNFLQIEVLRGISPDKQTFYPCSNHSQPLFLFLEHAKHATKNLTTALGALIAETNQDYC